MTGVSRQTFELMVDVVKVDAQKKKKPGRRTKLIIEDAIHKDSAHSYFIQLADVNAYFLSQKFQPNQYIKRKGGKNYLDRLQPVLFKQASKKDLLGIVIR